MSNSVGNLGGVVGPFAIGYIKGSGGSSTHGLLFLAALLVGSFLMTFIIRINEQRDNDVHDAVANRS